jgi:hypothetical protein
MNSIQTAPRPTVRTDVEFLVLDDLAARGLVDW